MEEVQKLEEKIQTETLQKMNLWIFGDGTSKNPGAFTEIILIKKDLSEIKNLIRLLTGIVITVTGAGAVYFFFSFLPRMLYHVGP